MSKTDNNITENKEKEITHVALLCIVKKLDDITYRIAPLKPLYGNAYELNEISYFESSEGEKYFCEICDSFKHGGMNQLAAFPVMIEDLIESYGSDIEIEKMGDKYLRDTSFYEYFAIAQDKGMHLVYLPQTELKKESLLINQNATVFNNSISNILENGNNFYDFVLSSLESILKEKNFDEMIYKLYNLANAYGLIFMRASAEYIKEFALIMNLNCNNFIKLNDSKTIASEILNLIFDLKESATLKKIRQKYNIDSKEFKVKTTDKNTKVDENKKIYIDVVKTKEYVDSIVIGQEDAKREAISTILMNMLADNKYGRNHCLLVGPTGCGKTLLMETIANHIGIPIEIVDSTQLTGQGYVGGKIEDHLMNLINKTNGDVTLAEHGILVFDELDKKGSKSNGDISQKAVLNEMLSLMSGTTYSLWIGDEKNGFEVEFDTSNLTIFGSGSFMDAIEKIKEEKSFKSGGNKIGFSREKISNSEDEKVEKLSPKDLNKYGDFPMEIIGRFTNIVLLDELSKDALKDILLTSKISPLILEKQKLAKLNIELDYSEDFIDRVVEEAKKLKTGGRGLKSIIEKAIKEARWQVLNSKINTYKGILLTEASVINPYDYYLIDIDNRQISALEQNDKTETEKVKKIGKI